MALEATRLAFLPRCVVWTRTIGWRLQEGTMADQELFLDKYRKFFRRRDQARGPEFHNPPPVNIPPPAVTFADRLRWSAWDRWKRRKQVRAERERRLQDILTLKRSGESSRSWR